MNWLAEHSSEIASTLASLIATGLFHLIWKLATMSAEIRRAKKDINNLGKAMGTEKGLAIAKREEERRVRNSQRESSK